MVLGITLWSLRKLRQNFCPRKNGLIFCINYIWPPTHSNRPTSPLRTKFLNLSTWAGLKSMADFKMLPETRFSLPLVRPWPVLTHVMTRWQDCASTWSPRDGRKEVGGHRSGLRLRNGSSGSGGGLYFPVINMEKWKLTNSKLRCRLHRYGFKL